MKIRFTALSLMFAFLLAAASAVDANSDVIMWMRFEQAFESSIDYENPLYDVSRFSVTFQAPSGRTHRIAGFWDGGRTWRVRFMPDEAGAWKFETECSDGKNKGLHGARGTFKAVANNSSLALCRKGAIMHPSASYHLAHADGTPFFWVGCTAWNGALKATDEEWKRYLTDRASRGYSVIQFAATQWRGCDVNRHGEAAFEGSGRIRINPKFYQQLDPMVDAINRHGLVAAPVMLWALPQGEGRELSPGYALPDNEAILLARYLVARYGGHHVAWVLGGDGKYVDEYEPRWKKIGRAVFGDPHPGVVALHSMGQSWIGREYAEEPWLDIVGYQSGHNPDERVARWITRGPVANEWRMLPPKVFINMEPIYERPEEGFGDHVRRHTWWSLFATPVAGVTYGAHVVWPWLHAGEKPLNHAAKSGSLVDWSAALEFPGNIQVGRMARFMNNLEWWRLGPAPELLLEQPGNESINKHVSALKTGNNDLIMVYSPEPQPVRMLLPYGRRYTVQWFDPASGQSGSATAKTNGRVLEVAPPTSSDFVLAIHQSAQERIRKD